MRMAEEENGRGGWGGGEGSTIHDSESGTGVSIAFDSSVQPR